MEPMQQKKIWAARSATIKIMLKIIRNISIVLLFIGCASLKLGKAVAVWFFNAVKEIPNNPLIVIPQISIVIGVFIFLSFFVYHLSTMSVFVEDVDIQGEATGKGLRGDILTEQALAAMLSVTAARLEQLPITPRFGELIERHSDRYETERYCNLDFQARSLGVALYTDGLARATMSSRSPDKMVVTDVFSIRKIAYWVRSTIGLGRARSLTPTLARIDNRYVMRVTSSPLPLQPAIEYFDEINDAPKILARMLVDYLAPQFRAVELLLLGRTQVSNFGRSLSIAESFLGDEQKSLFINHLIASSELERSRSQAGIIENYLRWGDQNRNLLARLDLSIYGDLAPVARISLTERVARGEYYQQGGVNEAGFKRLLQSRLNPLQDDLMRSREGQVVLALYQIRLGDERAFRQTLTKILEDHSLQEPERSEWRGQVITFLSLALMFTNRLADAQQVLGLIDTYAIPGVSDIEEARHVIFAVAQAAEGRTGNFAMVVGGERRVRPCYEMAAVFALREIIRDVTLSFETRTELRRLALISFKKLEASGIRNFVFFNNAGIAAMDANDLTMAGHFFSEALKYEGDEAWALLNWGEAARRANNLRLAREKYELSLAVDKIPAAVKGLLATLIQQHDAAAFVENARRYAQYLKFFPLHDRLALEQGAILLLCTRPGSTYEPFFLEPNERSELNIPQRPPMTGNRLLEILQIPQLVCP